MGILTEEKSRFEYFAMPKKRVARSFATSCMHGNHFFLDDPGVVA
jgi:hypothetical protein